MLSDGHRLEGSELENQVNFRADTRRAGFDEFREL